MPSRFQCLRHLACLGAAGVISLCLCLVTSPPGHKTPPPPRCEPIPIRPLAPSEQKNLERPKPKILPRPIKLTAPKPKSVSRPQIQPTPSLLPLDPVSPRIGDLALPPMPHKAVGPGLAGTGDLKGVFNAGQVDQPPRLKKYIPPIYPPRARGKRVQGEITVRALVLANGLVQSVQLVSNENRELLGPAAIAAVRKWTFYPAKQNGKRVKVMVDVPIQFNLNN